MSNPFFLSEEGDGRGMRVLIIGAGKVGYQIATSLSKDGHDIVVIDKEQERLEKVDANLDVLSLRGNGLSVKTLEEAQVGQCDLLIAVTNSDEANIVSCIIGKKIGAHKAIARIRDPEYAEELAGSKEVLGLDMIINPEKAAANEIARLLAITPAMHVEDFAKGRVRMVEVSVDANSAISNTQLKDLQVNNLLVTAIVRKGNIFIPSGDDTILPGDNLYVLGNTENMKEFYRLAGKKSQRIKNVTILGGSRIAVYLAKHLSKVGISVKIIERDEERCAELAEQLPNVLVINGDGSDIDTLKDENVSEMDGFVAVTGIDEENLIIALLAKQLGTKKVIAKVSRSAYARLVETVGVDAAISPRLITANDILRFVRGGKIVTLSVLFEGEVEILELIAHAQSRGVNRPLRELGLPKGVIIGSIVQKGKAHIPSGDDIIKPGNRVIVFALGQQVRVVQEMFSAPKEGGKASELWRNLKNLGRTTGQ